MAPGGGKRSEAPHTRRRLPDRGRRTPGLERPARRVPRGRGLRVRLLRARRGDDGRPRRPLASEQRPPHHHTPRAGRRVHGRRLRPPHRPLRRGDGDARARRHEPAHRRRRRLPRSGARWSRSRARRRRTSCTRRRTRSSTSSGCSSRSPSGTTGSSGPTSFPRSSARRSGVASWRNRDRPTSSCRRTWRRAAVDETSGRWARMSRTFPSRPTRRSNRRRDCSRRRIARSSSPATASCVVGIAELRAFARGLHVPVAATFMGKGAIDDRSHLSLLAVGLQARDHVLTGLRSGRPRRLGGLRPRRVRAGALEPGRTQADHPHRHDAGGGRRDYRPESS